VKTVNGRIKQNTFITSTVNNMRPAWFSAACGLT